MADLEIIGLLAGAFVAVGFIPQVLRVWKLRSAREISLTFTIFFLVGGILWITYGFVFGLLSIIVWNCINVSLLSLLFFAKLKYGMNRKK